MTYSIDAREITQLIESYRLLLAGLASHDLNTKSACENLALLTAPLGRALKASEAIVTVEDFYSLVPGGLDAAWQKTEFKTAYGHSIYNLQPGYVRLENAYVSKDGFVCYDHRLFIDYIQVNLGRWREGLIGKWFYEHNPILSSFAISDNSCIVDTSGPRHSSPAFLFSTMNASANFGHFVHDFLTELLIFRKLKREVPNIECLFGREFSYPVQTEVVKELFSEEYKTNSVRSYSGRCGWYSELYVPYPQFLGDHEAVGFESAAYARNHLVEIAKKRSSRSRAGKHRLFISRRDGGRGNQYNRNSIDHQTLEGAFSRYGFEIVAVGQLSVPEILEKFYECEIVAGVHGAGLLNVLFSGAPTPFLLELGAQETTWRSIERVTRAAGLDYKYLAPVMTNGVAEFPALEAELQSAFGSR